MHMRNVQFCTCVLTSLDIYNKIKKQEQKWKHIIRFSDDSREVLYFTAVVYALIIIIIIINIILPMV